MRWMVDCRFTFFFFSSRRRHPIFDCDWSSDVCSSDLAVHGPKHADEPLLPFCRGMIYVQAGQYELAEKAFAAGMAKAPEAQVLELFRHSREIGRASCRGRG